MWRECSNLVHTKASDLRMQLFINFIQQQPHDKDFWGRVWSSNLESTNPSLDSIMLAKPKWTAKCGNNFSFACLNQL